MTFAELGLAQPLLRAVSSEGYTTPTPIQSQAIPHAIAGSDVLACAQTGTGKTAAFALPILHRLGQADKSRLTRGRRMRALVLAPTRELAAQIGECFHAYGRHTPLRQTVIFGGVGQHPQVRALRAGLDIVTATPGRLLDLMNQGHVDISSVEMLVLDEADRMLDMGFLPDLRRIVAQLPVERQTMLFSATMPEPIARLASSILRNPVNVRIAPVKATTELITESVCFVGKQQKMDLLVELLNRQSICRALVFTRTKHGADRVAKHLNRSGIRADSIHGDKSQGARQRALASFRSDQPPVLVATDVAARGIDVDGVSHVFNFDMPIEPEMYLHRIGRTGRAGEAGTAISLCDGEERKRLKDIERLIRRALPTSAETREPERQQGNQGQARGAARSPERRKPTAVYHHARRFDRRPGKSSRRAGVGSGR
jgi:ATP-dependent RNA helicase RhlE